MVVCCVKWLESGCAVAWWSRGCLFVCRGGVVWCCGGGAGALVVLRLLAACLGCLRWVALLLVGVLLGPLPFGLPA